MAAKRSRKTKNSAATMDYVNQQGVVYTVFRVPQNIVSTVKPTRPKPPRPWITMTTASGEQKRPMKKGDEGWDEYLEAVADWEQERKDLVDSVSIVLAVGKHLWVNDEKTITLIEAEQDDLEFSEDTQIMLDAGLIELPDNIWALRAFWLDDWHFGQHDLIEIQWIIMKLNGTAQEVINNIKESFRSSVSRETAKELDAGDSAAETQ